MIDLKELIENEKDFELRKLGINLKIDSDRFFSFNLKSEEKDSDSKRVEILSVHVGSSINKIMISIG